MVLKVNRICTNCQKHFLIPASFIKKQVNAGKFCSRPCANAQNGRNSVKKIVLPRGPEHRLWKGGHEAMLIRKKLNLERNRARQAVYRAVKNGILEKKCCAVCNAVKSEAHHKDYLRPLEVEWLCRGHHREADYRDGTKSGDFGH